MEQKTGIFQRLKQGLSKTRDGILAAVFSGRDGIDNDFFESLEEALIMADVGMELTEELLDELRAYIKAERLTKAAEARTALRGILAEHMRTEEEFLPETGSSVLLIVGVNGVGKTTSIGKLANYYKQQGRRPMLAAADSSVRRMRSSSAYGRSARACHDTHGEGADPAAVVYDAIASFKAKGCDLLICDTAGRLHNKKNLMNELEKIRRVISRELPDAVCRVLLVLDATTGQNAIAQEKAFSDSAGSPEVV
jgi:fused signal recognition particle receptor